MKPGSTAVPGAEDEDVTHFGASPGATWACAVDSPKIDQMIAQKIEQITTTREDGVKLRVVEFGRNLSVCIVRRCQDRRIHATSAHNQESNEQLDARKYGFSGSL